jgi:sensor histidine kinase YesM
MKKFLADLILAVKVVLILSVVSIIINIIAHGEVTWNNIKMNLFYNVYYGITLTFVNGWFLHGLEKIVSWERAPKTRLWLGILGSILVTMITLIGLNYVLWILIWGNESSSLFSTRNLNFYIIALMITVIVSSLLHAIGFFKEVQQEKKISESLRQEKLISELNALKAHVDPHFLFNSFNVLSGLIEEDKEKAQDFLAGLSKIYRYILESRDEDTSTVREELNFAQSYLDLHLARFENSIKIDVDIPQNTLKKSLPSLTLQLLLENAIKHNAFDADNPLNIKIHQEDEYLVVENNRKKRMNLAISNGLGLKNIKDRYSLLSNDIVTVTDATDIFRVKIPLLN